MTSELNSQMLSANFGGASSILQAQFGGARGTSSLSSVLQLASQPTVSPSLQFTQDGTDKSLNSILQAEQRLDPNFNLLSSLGGFSSYTGTESLLEAAYSSQQSQFDQLV